MLISFQADRPHTLDSAGVFAFQEPQIHADRILLCHVFLYLEYGTWNIEYLEQKFFFKAGDVMIMPAHIRHHGISVCAPGTRGIFLHYLPNEKDTVQNRENFSDTSICLSPNIHTVNSEHVNTLFLDILRQYQTARPLAQRLSSSLFDTLLLTLEGQQKEKGFLLKQIDMLLHEHMDQFLTNGEIAAVLNLSVKSLERLFHTETGQTLHNYQLWQKLESARILLRTYPGITLNEISCMLGFYDAAHLSRSFKKRYGVTPCAMRNGNPK